MLQLKHSGNFRNLFLSFPVKPGLPTAPQYSTSKARGSPQPPSKVPAKPGLPTAPQYSTSKARAPHSPQHSTSEARAPHSPPAQYQQSQGSPQPPSTVPAKPGLPQPPVQYQPPGTITGTACLSPVSEEAPSHQGPSQGLPASLQCQKKLPATRDHHRDCLPLSSARRSSQPTGIITGTVCLSQHQKKLPATRDHHRACLSSVNIHWIFIHSNWKHHD